ncbi:unnamed protein product, partial [Didymodactylos carnosus]
MFKSVYSTEWQIKLGGLVTELYLLGATHVYLFGSSLHDYHQSNDIDICVDGNIKLQEQLSIGDKFAKAFEKPIDIVHASCMDMNETIMKHGILLTLDSQNRACSATTHIPLPHTLIDMLLIELKYIEKEKRNLLRATDSLNDVLHRHQYSDDTELLNEEIDYACINVVD